MADESKKRAFTTSLIWYLIGIFAIVMIVSQIVIYLSVPVRTETATFYTVTDSISFKGVYVRDEKLVSCPVKGVISYTHPDGSKIAKNSVVALDYRNRNDIAVKQEIEELTAIRAILGDAQSLAGTDSSQLESFSNQISEKHGEIIRSLCSGDYAAASELKSDILGLGSKRDIVKGTQSSYADRISEIDRRIQQLTASLSSEPDEIPLYETGYFVSKVDGYENKLDTESVFELTESEIDEIVSGEIGGDNPPGIIGKLIGDYSWYMVAVLDTVKLGTVFEGAQVTLRIGSSGQNVEADIVSLKRQDDGRSIAIFKCDMFLADFIGSRVTQAKLLTDNYTGIRLPHEALRMEGGEAGVFIRDGIVVKFRKIKIVMSEPDFILAADTSGEEGYLSLYDSVIVEGRDLYDGKIIG